MCGRINPPSSLKCWNDWKHSTGAYVCDRRPIKHPYVVFIGLKKDSNVSNARGAVLFI